MADPFGELRQAWRFQCVLHPTTGSVALGTELFRDLRVAGSGADSAYQAPRGAPSTRDGAPGPGYSLREFRDDEGLRVWRCVSKRR